MAQRPNILWFCTDQQRSDTIHALGNDVIRTPNLDRLVSEGVAFTQAYTQCPICTASRASFLTGMYPSTIHVNRNGNEYFPDDVRLVTKTLADAGYDCGLSGKLHLAGADARVEPRTDDGYRFYKWSHHPSPETFWGPEHHAYQGWLRDVGIDWDEAYKAQGWNAWDPETKTGISAEYHQTTWCVNEALAFIEQDRNGPWLMSINPFDPHPPFDPPAEYMARMDIESMPMPVFVESDLAHQRELAGVDHQTAEPVSPHDYDAKKMVAAYYAQIELIDDQIGRLIDYLDETGQRENTIIIFASDHGEMLGDHGLCLKGCRFYEAQAHIPLIISWPGHIQQDVRSDALVELVDLAPTLLEFAGVSSGPVAPGHPTMQGRSLAGLLTGEAPLDEHRDFVRCEFHDAIEQPHASHGNMIYDGRFKLCRYHGPGLGELFDLANDPNEFINLCDDPDYLSVRVALTEKLFDALEQATDPGQPRVGRY